MANTSRPQPRGIALSGVVTVCFRDGEKAEDLPWAVIHPEGVVSFPGLPEDGTIYVPLSDVNSVVHQAFADDDPNRPALAPERR